MFASARKRSSAGGSTTLAGAASAREVIAIDDDTQTADATTQTSSSASTILVATGESRVAPTASAPPAKKRKLTAAAAADQLLASSPALLVNSLPTLSRPMTFFSSPYWSYSPAAIGGAAATRYYEALRSMVDPEPGTIFLYGKYHKENRLTKCFARHAGGFAYSGTVKSASGEWPAEIEELYQIAVRDQAFDTTRLPTDFQQRVKDASARRTADVDASSVAASSASASSAAFAASAPVYWDTVLINYYRDGSDSISWHSDKDSKHFPIASFSFGAEREFQIRERPSPGGGKSTKQLATYSHILAHGSLLLMWPGMQERYHHSVPKRKGIANGRVNVTFRLHHRADATTAITAKA